MKIHYGGISPNSRRALAVAYELGFEPELIPIKSFEDFEAPEFLKKNPNGLVPILVDGDFVLWESHAIAQYLAEKAGALKLFPNDPKGRADVSRWQFWTAAHFDPACGPFLWENGFKQFLAGGGAPDPGEIQKATEEFKVVAGVLNGHLAKRLYLVGEGLTLADFSVAAVLMYTERCKIPLGEFPHIRRWLEMIRSTDGWKRSEKIIPGLPPGF